jgi:hypothetical protein
MVAEIASAPPAVAGAIRNAARMTGANFQYLLATAKVESNLNPNATGRTSSAKGLFQFIEQTWLATLKEQGPALGYGKVAQAIERNAAGQYTVSDPRREAAIMDLRADPTANAVMAGAFTKDNAAKLAGQLGRKPSEGELYLAHFLGPNGAAKLITLATDVPGARAADAFPGAARANPSIFYDRQGRARTAGQVYGELVGRYASARQTPAPAMAAATANVPMPPVRAAYAPEAARMTDTYAAAAKLADIPAQPVAQLGDTGPAFHGLFHTPGQFRRDAVSPVVSALWGAPAPVPPQASTKPAVMPEPQAQPPAANGAPVQTSQQPVPLDLFQDNLPDARALFRGRV